MSRDRLAISFSGGRSSAVMVNLCLGMYRHSHEILITFANTGCEHEETLRFVDAVDRHICQPAGHKVVWIEAEIHHGKRKGPTAKVVDFETASRNGEPFEEAIKKHGVFCKTHPQCTSRLKEEPLIAYRRSQGWGPGTYDTAIGIRADEADRMSSKRKEKRFIYPLVELGINKHDVNQTMSQFDWDLNLTSDAYGNCVWCWKKSNRKLMTVALESPAAFLFPARMEREYGHINNGASEQHKPRVFFRGRRSTTELLVDAMSTEFTPFTDAPRDPWNLNSEWSDHMDLSEGSCGESCEVGADS